jgi:hypothetical protein
MPAKTPAPAPAAVATPVFATSIPVNLEPVSRLNLTRLASFSAAYALALASLAARYFANICYNSKAFAEFNSALSITIKPSSIVYLVNP